MQPQTTTRSAAKPMKKKLLFPNQRVRQARLDAGFTQEQVAERAGCDEQFIVFIEDGLIPFPRNLIQIGTALGVNPAWLQFGEPWASRDLPPSYQRYV